MKLTLGSITSASGGRLAATQGKPGLGQLWWSGAVRRNLAIADTDVHALDVTQGISISVTLGDLPDSTPSIETFGEYLRGPDAPTGTHLWRRRTRRWKGCSSARTSLAAKSSVSAICAARPDGRGWGGGH